MACYLAIDQGTHASRACLFDDTGRLVSEQTKDIKLNRISNNRIEHDADEIVDSVKIVVDKLLHEAGSNHEIVACGIAVQRASVLAWSNDGKAISPVLSWQDTRASQQVSKLSEFEELIQHLSGLPLSAHYGASKLHYLLDEAKNDNRCIENIRLSPLISYLLYHLLDQQSYIVDHTNAQRTQLFSISEMRWSTRLIELFDVPQPSLPECVPVLNNTDNAHGKLAGTDIPVRAICGDQNAAFFGTGHMSQETALVNLGSGAFVLRLLSHYRASKNQLCTIACSQNSSVQYVREATINGAGSALNWIAQKHNVADIREQLPAWLDEVDSPPVFINTIGGLASPWWNEKLEAEFILLSTDNSIATQNLPSQAVAVIESIVFMICANLEIMHDEQRLDRLRVCGGLSQIDGLCQRLANLSGLPVERVTASEATARGIAWLAAGRPHDWSHIDLEMFEPENTPGLSQRYALFNDTLQQKL